MAISESREARLISILNLKKIDEDLFLGDNESLSVFRLFGGQVLAQAVRAAYQTVKDRHAHSLHAYFLKGGIAEQPVLFEVERVRDGKSFTTRRVVAIQNGDAIFNMDLSFQIEESGFQHSDPMPNVPPPEELADDIEVALSLDQAHGNMSPMAKIKRPFQTRSVFRLGSEEWGKERFSNPVWIKFRGEVESEDQEFSRCLISYASDMGLVSTSTLPHQPNVARDSLQLASLDHSLWIHRDVPIDEWILFHKKTSSANGSRGMNHAEFFSQNGELIASVSQEGLLRSRAD
jgi:acyl-CoA thioesterase-2